MSIDKWSASEKKIVRRAFDAALERKFAVLMSQLTEMAAKLASPADRWDMHHFLSDQLQDIERKYDYRYSQLIIVFGRLMRQKWIDEKDLKDLSTDKMEAIRYIASELVYIDRSF